MLNLILSLALGASLYTGASELELEPNKPLGNTKPIEEALIEFHHIYHKQIEEPEYIPFKPTISGGNVDKSQDSLRLDYLNENDNKTLSINVFTKDIKIQSENNKDTSSATTLENGIEAKIINDKRIDFMFISFVDESDLKYVIGVNKNKYKDMNECITELTKVANSIQ